VQPRALSYRRTSRLAWRRIGDELVIVNLAAKEMIGLDATAGVLFERLARPSTPDTLTGLFAGSPDGRGTAIAAFCRELTALGVLEPAAPPADAGPEPAGTLAWSEPRVLWHEPLTAVVNQASPPPALGNPQCGY